MSDDRDIGFSIAMCRAGFGKDKCAIGEQHIGYNGGRQVEKWPAERNGWSSYLCNECGYLYDAESSPRKSKDAESRELPRTMPRRALFDAINFIYS